MKTIKYLFLTSLAIQLSSCAGESSNPLEKYQNLKISDPTDQKVENQSVLQPDLFDISIQGNQQQNQGQFTEGKTTDVVVFVKVKSSKITKYNLELIDFSSEQRPELIIDPNQNTYIIRWQPAAGTIPAGQWGKLFQGTLRATVTESSHPSLIGIVKTSRFDLVVNRNSAQPKILGQTDLTDKLEEGTQTSFSVDIEDPAASENSKLPEIQVTPYIYSNTEAYRADGSQYLILDYSKKQNPELIGKNRFRFYYILQPNQLPLDKDRLGNDIPNANKLDICFQLRAISTVGTMSAQIQICGQAKYATLAPDLSIKINNTDIKEVKSNIENIIQIEISAEHKLASVVFKNSKIFLQDLSGKKEMNCLYQQAQMQNHLICQIKWTPLCVKTETLKKLSVIGMNNLNKSTKETNLNIEVMVQPNPETCTQPAKPTVSQKTK